MRFQPVRSFGQTLRGRLTLWNTAGVSVLVVANLLASRGGLDWARSQMVDEFVQEELHSAVLDFERLRAQPDRLRARYDRQATGHPRRRLFIQLLEDDSGAIAWSSTHSPNPDSLASDVRPFDQPVTVNNYRVICEPVAGPNQERWILRVGCSLGRAHREIARFTEILAAVGLIVLLIVPIGGFLLAGRATRPLARIIQTTARLNPTHLDERLPLRGTRDELDQLSRTINRFLDRIASYLQQSRDFTANAAHELRSPLMALQSSLEVALNSDRTVEEYKEVLAILLEECGHLRVLVNQLLLLAEGDAGRLRLQPQTLRLDQIVVSSREMFQVVAEAAGVQLCTSRIEPVLVRGDGNRLWQVVNNLIDNAIKFTPSGGRVSLDLRLDEATQQGILEVIDTGAGIAAQDLPHIFERFFQGDKARQRENPARGVGLGLSICQAIVEAHGGTITVVSKSGQGTTFTICFPDCTRADDRDTPSIPDAPRRPAR
jgi:heavy metal sensor kinase